MESFADFAHGFLETQHCLEKLIPGINCAGGDFELMHAFILQERVICFLKNLLCKTHILCNMQTNFPTFFSSTVLLQSALGRVAENITKKSRELRDKAGD